MVGDVKYYFAGDCHRTGALHLFATGARTRCHATVRVRAATRAATVAEVVPVRDGVEGERPRTLGLISPEWPDREHHDMAVAQRRIDHRRFALHVLRIVQHA